MPRTKKKTEKMKLIAICIALLMIISIAISIFNVVFAIENRGSIQVSGMTSINSGYAAYEAMTNPGHEAGKIIGISLGENDGGFDPTTNGDMGTMLNDEGGNKYIYENVKVGTYTFRAEVNTGYSLNNVMIGEAGSETMTPAALIPVPETNNQFTFTVIVATGKTATVNPSFAFLGGNPPPPPGGQNEGNNPPPQGASNTQIWVDGVIGAGFDGAVIDTNANPPISSYTGTGFSIDRGVFHNDYQINISSGVTMPAIKAEGTGLISIVPGANENPNGNDENVQPSKISANVEGYSIFSEDSESCIYVETMKGKGVGDLELAGGVDIRGNFGVLDHSIQIGSANAKSTKGIKAAGIVVDYAQLKMYCSNIVFEGLSETEKMNIDVLNQAKLTADTSLATGTALNNVGKISVMCGGEANITHTGGCTLGTLNKAAKYYDFVNFETTQVVEEMEDVKEITAIAPGDGKYYSMTESSTVFNLKSLSKPLYTLSFNMTDEDGNIVEDTKVEHGTVKIKTACGIGRGADGRGCNDFRIEQGTPVLIELLPDYGYQFTSGSLNGEAMTTAQGEIATYEFNMPSNHLHLSAIFTPAEDSIVVDNDDIVDASISNLEGQINGNAEFKVQNAEDVNKDKFDEAADGATIVGFTELSLNQVVLKGNETDAWKTGITDLQEPMGVALKVSEEMAAELEKGKSVGVLRDHNGEVSLIEASYNKETKQLEFDTDGYSTYAIVYSLTESNAKSGNSDGSVKTGDMVLMITIPTIAIIAVANIILIKKQKAHKRS